MDLLVPDWEAQSVHEGYSYDLTYNVREVLL
jgi:hypothetical protein